MGDNSRNTLPIKDDQHYDHSASQVETETNLLLGKMQAGRRVNAQIQVSAHANRVAVFDGHTIAMSIKFRQKPSVEDAIRVLENFRLIEASFLAACGLSETCNTSTPVIRPVSSRINLRTSL